MQKTFAIISTTHNNPAGWIIAGAIFLANVWIMGIRKIVRNKKKRRVRQLTN